MYLRTQGERHSLFHSYRDGRGKVGQRRIYDLGDSSELARWLRPANWRALQAEVSQRCPELKPDWNRLHAQAQQRAAKRAGEGKHPAPRDERIRAVRKACQTLMRLLEREEDKEVARLAGDDLARLREMLDPPDEEQTLEEGERLLARGDLAEAVQALQKTRQLAFHRLPLGRKILDPAEPYLRALDLLGEALKRQCRFEEAEEVLRERVHRCGTPESRTAYGAILQILKRPEEALEQFQRLPRKDPARFYNEAAALLDAGRYREALSPLLIGLVRNPLAAKELKEGRKRVMSWPRSSYWRQHEEIWSEGGLRFFTLVAEQTLVGWRMSRATGARVRTVLNKQAQELLFKRVWAAWRDRGGKPRSQRG